MQLGRLEEAGAVGGFNSRLDGLAIAVNRHRDLETGRTERPYLAIEAGEIADLGARDRQQHVPGAQIGLLRRTILGKPYHHDAILDRGCVEPEPGSWRRLRPGEGREGVP